MTSMHGMQNPPGSTRCAQDVPDHMKRFVVRDKLFGLKYITGYECRKCNSLWRWHASQSWVFIAAPKTRISAVPATTTSVRSFGKTDAQQPVAATRLTARAHAALS